MQSRVIIIGDSSHNTLSAVRSFGEANLSQVLLLVCQEDFCHVSASKYLKRGNCITIPSLDDCMPELEKLHSNGNGQTLMTTFDAAAEWVDKREQSLSQWFITPCRGRQLGDLFNKEKQCQLAEKCGLYVPHSMVYHRGDRIDAETLTFPLITKPLVSSAGTKGDIHICHDFSQLEKALSEDSCCDSFLIQQFIEKEYEIDAIGISIDEEVVMGGAVRKFRHWPKLTGAGAYGLFDKIGAFNVNINGIREFLQCSGYHGPFSIEFLHTSEGKNYFMEVNFRNEGLAYASTCAGANLHALYLDSSKRINWKRFKKCYMMNYSIDFLYVKDGSLSLWQWLRDFIRTRCFINICFSDLGPAIQYYKSKFFRTRSKL